MIVDYTQMIRLKPDDYQSYLSRGQAKSDKKDFDGAFADYTKAIEIAPRERHAYLGRGLIKEAEKIMPEQLPTIRRRSRLLRRPSLCISTARAF